MTPQSHRGRRVLVTAGDTGIGRAVALAFAGQGADLVVHHFSNSKSAEAVADAARGLGVAVSVLEADLTQPGAAGSLARAVLSEGPVDIAVINAAIERRCDWNELSEASIANHVAANFTATIALAQALVPGMRAKGWGRIIATGSIMAARPRAETLAYAALKSAQLTAVAALAREVGRDGITVNVVSPGSIETDRSRAALADPEVQRTVIAKVPVGRIGTPEDCVPAYLMLAAEESGYITGVNIPVDGGWSAGDALAANMSPR
ncbi:3-oxoacyl-[acyl-carrier protein] reductase [Aliiruegeria haliotis]|uniref:3-oxoacyl-[acyl-carrier protein] reductase n=1 Tax=Aliiruegeria haliotis TaxID=1280846 RepID=A0A2T0RLX1_9RHOB|nr:SDR family oxidoreductase [Aliiruegeria haliotis]PRY22189.1 3-oxoacyl-[acyl-carrier protein] reductase [Aliiruegeria haliotis]